jgi:hypothetical protein
MAHGDARSAGAGRYEGDTAIFEKAGSALTAAAVALRDKQ